MSETCPAGTLVVCPKMLALQWVGEVERKLRCGGGAAPRVLLHHGAGRARAAADLAAFDVVVTTYSTLRSEADGRRRDGLRCWPSL